MNPLLITCTDYATSERAVITTTPSQLLQGKRTRLYMSGRVDNDHSKIPAVAPASNISSPNSNMAALDAIADSEHNSSSLSPAPPSQPLRKIAEDSTVVKKKAEKQKVAKGKGKKKQTAVDEDDVVEVSSDEPAPKKKRKKAGLRSTPTPTYVASGSDDEDDSDYEGPTPGSELKRKPKASGSRRTKSCASPAPSPSPAAITSRQKTAPITQARPKATPTNLALRLKVQAGHSVPPSTLSGVVPISSGIVPISPLPRLAPHMKTAVEREVAKQLNLHSRPNPYHPIPSNTGAPAMSRALTPATPSEEVTPRSQGVRVTTPVDRKEDATPTTNLEDPSRTIPSNISSPATMSRTLTPGNTSEDVTPHSQGTRVATPTNRTEVPAPGAAPAASVQGPRAMCEAASPMMHHAHVQGFLRHPVPQQEYEYAGLQNSMMHPAPPPQGHWGQPSYYHPMAQTHGYGQGLPGYAPGYNPSPYAGQAYHPPPQHLHAGPSNVPYNMAPAFTHPAGPQHLMQHAGPSNGLAAFGGQAHPSHLNATPTDTHSTSPAPMPFIAQDGNFQHSQTKDGAI